MAGAAERYQTSQSEWDRIADSRQFKDLMATKKTFIVPAFIFFVVYYFALPVLVGYAPKFMSTKVIGEVNLAYLFALSQFFVAWIIAALYVRAANNFDRSGERHHRGCPERERSQVAMSTSLVMFLVFIAITLGITYWASKRSSGSSAYFAAGRQIKGWQNGIAVAGDYMSAASFLGIAGIIAFQGYDGFMYSVGWLVAYLTVLLVVAEPLRNAGKYTMADVLAYRLKPRPVRAMASISTLTVSTFYMIAQMVGAGTLVALLLRLRHQVSGGSHRRRHSDDRVRGLRRHARHHVGADHQSHSADGRNDSAEHPGARPLRLQLRRLLQRHRPCHLSRRQGPAGGEGLSAAGAALQAAVRRARPDFAWSRPHLRNRRAATHPGALLHRARRQDRAPQRGLGHGADRHASTS